LVKDAFAVRLFADAGVEMVLAQSFSKNLGLYGERAGCASVICASPEARKACDTHLRGVIRPMYSNPPKHGAYIVKGVLGNPVRYEEWLVELNQMSGRILEMRQLLRAALEARNCPGAWNHITDQIGMFSYTGLTGKKHRKDFFSGPSSIFFLRRTS
jgi:aspartate/tyrosine/aromatic aminotransferase